MALKSALVYVCADATNSHCMQPASIKNRPFVALINLAESVRAEFVVSWLLVFDRFVFHQFKPKVIVCCALQRNAGPV